MKVFRFPSDRESGQRWLDTMPNKIEFDNVTENMGVCELHWPPHATYKGEEHLLPLNPPSVREAPNITNAKL